MEIGPDPPLNNGSGLPKRCLVHFPSEWPPLADEGMDSRERNAQTRSRGPLEQARATAQAALHASTSDPAAVVSILISTDDGQNLARNVAGAVR